MLSWSIKKQGILLNALLNVNEVDLAKESADPIYQGSQQGAHRDGKDPGNQ